MTKHEQIVADVSKLGTSQVYRFVEFSGEYWCNFCQKNAYRELHPEYGHPVPPNPFPHSHNCVYRRSLELSI